MVGGRKNCFSSFWNFYCTMQRCSQPLQHSLALQDCADFAVVLGTASSLWADDMSVHGASPFLHAGLQLCPLTLRVRAASSQRSMLVDLDAG